MEIIDIVRKLIGPVEAVGDSGLDEKRLKNLEATCDLVNRLLYDIHQASHSSDNHQHSMKVIGQRAKEFLQEVKDSDI